MNIQQGITTSNRNQPVHWEHTINIWAVATGATKGQELKRGEGEAFKTEATAAESARRGIWCGKASRQRGGQQEPSQPQNAAEAGLVSTADTAISPGAAMCLVCKIRSN